MLAGEGLLRPTGTIEIPHPRRVRRWSRPFANVPTFYGNWMAGLRAVLTITGSVLGTSTFASALIFSGSRMVVLKVGPKSIGSGLMTSKHIDPAAVTLTSCCCPSISGQWDLTG